jgi:TusA-related sulfurtransferase
MARDLPMVAASLGLRLLDQNGRRGDYRFRLVKRANPQPERPGRFGLTDQPSPDKPKEDAMSQLLDQAPETSHVVDARGSACPGPLLEAKKAIGAVKVGEVLEVISNDPGTKGDIPIWAAKVGHEYLGHVLGDGCERVFVRRRK